MPQCHVDEGLYIDVNPFSLKGFFNKLHCVDLLRPMENLSEMFESLAKTSDALMGLKTIFSPTTSTRSLSPILIPIVSLVFRDRKLEIFE